MRKLVLASVFSLGLAAVASAQWSSDSSVNLPLADLSNTQVQPKIAALSDGGFFVSWFYSDPNGSPAFGYDVYLQRLDPDGNELWAHNGIVIADRGFSSTQDYGLAVDSQDHALLAFRDDRFTGTQITITRVAPDGTQVWGPNGVQVTNTTDFVAAPKIAGTTNDFCMVAWTQGSDARLMLYHIVSGVSTWGFGNVVLQPPAGSYSVSDIQPADTFAIVSFVHQTGGFGSPRHLLAQKVDLAGSLRWNGTNHVKVFDGGSLQFGNFPTFVPDGSEGAVFSWYDVAGASLQCYAQRLLDDGTEVFAHNGVALSTNATRQRVAPSVGFDPVNSEVFSFWTELNSTQSMRGVYGQKLDAGGNRQWTDNGAEVVALGTDDISFAQTLPAANGAWAAWLQGGFGASQVRAERVDGSGATAVADQAICSVISGKGRLASAISHIGMAALVWQDTRNGSDDIFAQNIDLAGDLGPSAGPYCFANATDCPCANGGSGAGGCDIAQGLGGVELTVDSHSPDGLGGGQAIFRGMGYPFGNTPTAIMIRSTAREPTPVVFGDGTRCVGVQNFVRFGATSAFAGQTGHTANHGAGAGTFHYQIWFRNTPVTFCDSTAAFNLSNGFSLVWP